MAEMAQPRFPGRTGSPFSAACSGGGGPFQRSSTSTRQSTTSRKEGGTFLAALPAAELGRVERHEALSAMQHAQQMAGQCPGSWADPEASNTRGPACRA